MPDDEVVLFEAGAPDDKSIRVSDYGDGITILVCDDRAAERAFYVVSYEEADRIAKAVAGRGQGSGS